MKRKQFSLIFVAFALGFLLVQIIIFKNINQDIVETFLSICNQQGIFPIVMDPYTIQQGLQSNSVDHQVLLCDNCGTDRRLFTTLAVKDKLVFSSKILKENGLHVFEVKVTDPRIQSVSNLLKQTNRSVNSLHSSKVTSHYFIQSKVPKSHILHFIVLFERADDSSSYLWHSPIRWSDASLPNWLRQSLRLEDLHYGATAGAFENFRLKTVKMKDYVVQIPENLLPQVDQSTFIECNYTRAQEFYRHINQNLRQIDDDTFVANAKAVMLKGREILNKLGVRFWLSSGNCLGWYRQCGIIPYSQDVDFGIWIKDQDDRIIPAFQGGGFTLKNIFGKVTDSYELSFLHVKTGVKLDLFFFYEEKDYMWNGGTEYSTGNKYKYIFPKFTLCWTDLLGMKFRVPCETQSYVEANYGKNWIEPVTSWDWKDSPPNVHPNGVWSEEEWDDVIQVYDNVNLEDMGIKLNN